MPFLPPIHTQFEAYMETKAQLAHDETIRERKRGIMRKSGHFITCFVEII